MLNFSNKESVRGQRSNFRIFKILMYTIDSKLKFNKKSISDGPRAPKRLLLKIRGQRYTLLVALLSMVHQFKKWLLD
jgi:hypothetical protein